MPMDAHKDAEQRSLTDRIGNRLYAVPGIAQWWAKRSAKKTGQVADVTGDIPFTRMDRPLRDARVALVTTGGIHLRSQPPYDMVNPDGDASFREIPAEVLLDELVITHKYYDHTDADRDPNVIFPLEHLRNLVRDGVLGSVSPRHFGFMGHIDGPKVAELVQRGAPEVAGKLKQDGVDCVLLTPA
jgi:D-proline reductase (dithiol) PrdB